MHDFLESLLRVFVAAVWIVRKLHKAIAVVDADRHLAQGAEADEA